MSFRVRMQICLSPEKYAMKLRPYFVRFMDTRGEQRHVPVESYSYAHDCVLSVVFAHDEKEASAAQSPVVCFDPDDTGVNHEGSNSIESSVCIYTADEYTRMFQRVADVRDKLAEAFPGCRQLDMGFMNDRLLIVFELKGFFSVAVSSADDMPMFVWDRRGLKPLNRANMRLGMGFVVQMWMAGGGLDTFWYEHSGNVRAFPSVEAMVRAADDGFRTPRIRPEVHLHCDQVCGDGWLGGFQGMMIRNAGPGRVRSVSCSDHPSADGVPVCSGGALHQGLALRESVHRPAVALPGVCEFGVFSIR